MATDACGAALEISVPSSTAGGLPPYQALGPAQPGRAGPPQGTLPAASPHFRRSRESLLLGLGVSVRAGEQQGLHQKASAHIRLLPVLAAVLERVLQGAPQATRVPQVLHLFLGILTLTFGSFLATTVGEAHLVVLKCWYPFWGAASFLASGTSVLTMGKLLKSSLVSWRLEIVRDFEGSCAERRRRRWWQQSRRTWAERASLTMALCLATSLVSFLCTLAGLFVLCKDLFLETPFPRPDRTPYPNPKAHVQQLELALLCCTTLELLLTVLTAIAAHRRARQWAQDTGSSPPAPPADLELWHPHPSPRPPPSYEEVTRAAWSAPGFLLAFMGSYTTFCYSFMPLSEQSGDSQDDPHTHCTPSAPVWEGLEVPHLPPVQVFSQMVQDKPLRTSWQRKMQERQQRQLARDLARHLEEEKARRRQEKKQRRAENLRRCLENERRAEVVQVIRNPAKLKRAKKKQLRSVQKRDTLSPGGASARRNVARAPASQALGRNPPTRGAESGVPQPQGGNVTPSVPRPGDPGAHAPPRP
ncbi:Membrane-spanning 4-domains subfamily A member 10 [Fukomys damarensis]|uniref:Coiled-coil domain-containing protein 86 n=1 Tax=Fukomys damarensis TaxID=885580 RepID=A0A091DGQ2_FUKDA|nr:Membrane-spanning 4-domains subfamily A member 10 [Fukomys damarensis]